MQDMRDKILDNLLLIGFIGVGLAFLIIGFTHPPSEVAQAVGAAFIIAGCVGIYMMLTTRQVAKNLYKRFDEQNTTLTKMDETLVGIAASQKEMAATLRDIREILQK